MYIPVLAGISFCPGWLHPLPGTRTFIQEWKKWWIKEIDHNIWKMAVWIHIANTATAVNKDIFRSSHSPS